MNCEPSCLFCPDKQGEQEYILFHSTGFKILEQLFKHFKNIADLFSSDKGFQHLHSD